MIHPYVLAIVPVCIVGCTIIRRRHLLVHGDSGVVALELCLIYLGFMLSTFAYVENSTHLNLPLVVAGFSVEIVGFFCSITVVLKTFDGKLNHMLYFVGRMIMLTLLLTSAVSASNNHLQTQTSLWVAATVSLLVFFAAVRINVLPGITKTKSSNMSLPQKEPPDENIVNELQQDSSGIRNVNRNRRSQSPYDNTSAMFSL